MGQPTTASSSTMRAIFAILALTAAARAEVVPEPRVLKPFSSGKTILEDGELAVVTAPGYPLPYSPNANISMFIEPKFDNMTLTVSCNWINIAASKKCKADSLTIASDGYSYSKTYCGKAKVKAFEQKGGNVTFSFISDAKKEGKGFLCFVKAVAPTPCECGKTSSIRIVGGSKASQGQFPWLVALSAKNKRKEYRYQPFCGASLYNNKYVITAAHCVKGVSPKKTEVLLGMYDWAKEMPEPIVVKPKKFYVHQNYSSRTVDNDIAVIELAEPVPYSPDVMPVCMPNASLDYTGSMAYVAGWGLDAMINGSQPNMTYWTKVPIVSNTTCNESYPGGLTDNMICAGLKKGGKDACQGDSGGPLTVINDDKAHELAGVVSWGRGCALKQYYGVYAKTQNYLSWIFNIAGFGCQKIEGDPFKILKGDDIPQ